jgi:hypothetical protein
MNHRPRTALVLLLAAACALALGATAAARTKHSNLRVEAVKKTLDSGTEYSNGSITTRNSNACGPRDSKRERIKGSNAMGIVGHAADVDKALAPFRTSDTFDFGLIVCQIGKFKGFENKAWLYKVNHRAPTIGADQRPVGRGDAVLWYFANFSSGRNTGAELALRGVPVAARPGDAFAVKVVAYSDKGKKSPAEGAKVRGAAMPTGPNGTTIVTARSSPGTMRVEGRRGDDIATAPVEVCVKQRLSRCPDRRGETFVGTGRGDDIRATGGPDLIRARGGRDLVRARDGADSIRVKGGGRDRVNCGSGRDQVKADRRDRLAANCES